MNVNELKEVCDALIRNGMGDFPVVVGAEYYLCRPVTVKDNTVFLEGSAADFSWYWDTPAATEISMEGDRQ